jgi:hypothetical protein
MKKHKRLESIKQALRQPWTFPGGYPLSFHSYDGPLCHQCVKGNFRAVVNDTRMNCGGWNVTVDVIWEGEAWCADCGDEIETAYGPLKEEGLSVFEL